MASFGAPFEGETQVRSCVFNNLVALFFHLRVFCFLRAGGTTWRKARRIALRLLDPVRRQRKNGNAGRQALRHMFLKLALCFHTHSGFVFGFPRIHLLIASLAPIPSSGVILPSRASNLRLPSFNSRFTIHHPGCYLLISSISATAEALRARRRPLSCLLPSPR